MIKAKDIFKETTCLTEEEVLRYMKKKLSKDKIRQVEHHLSGCEFCSDALDGYDALDSKKINSSLIQLKKRLPSASSNRNKRRVIPIYIRLIAAACVAMLAVGTAVVYLFDFGANQNHLTEHVNDNRHSVVQSRVNNDTVGGIVNNIENEIIDQQVLLSVREATSDNSPELKNAASGISPGTIFRPVENRKQSTTADEDILNLSESEDPEFTEEELPILDYEPGLVKKRSSASQELSADDLSKKDGMEKQVEAAFPTSSQQLSKGMIEVVDRDKETNLRSSKELAGRKENRNFTQQNKRPINVPEYPEASGSDERPEKMDLTLNDLNMVIIEARDLLEKKNYLGVLELIHGTEDASEIQLISGIANYYINEFEIAEKQLVQVLKKVESGSDLFSEAQWYLGLNYLNQRKKGKAIDLFKELSRTESKFKNRAIEKLAEVK